MSFLSFFYDSTEILFSCNLTEIRNLYKNKCQVITINNYGIFQRRFEDFVYIIIIV